MQYNGPLDQPSNPNASYNNGNPSAGIQGSIPPGAAIEDPQREIVNFETLAGLTPSDAGGSPNLTQLAQAVQTSAVHWGIDTGSTNAISVTLNPVPAKYYTGMVVRVLLANTVSGATIINCNGLGAKSVVLNGLPLTAAVVTLGTVIEIIYDGTKFQIIGGASTYTPGAPVYLQAPKTFYVNGSTGSDSYDGLAATVGGGHGPFATIQKATAQVPLYNINSYSITINVADGNYLGQVACPPLNGSGSVFLTGNVANPQNCTITTSGSPGVLSTVVVTGNGLWNISGFRVQADAGAFIGDPGAGIYCTNGASVTLGAIRFGTTVAGHIESVFTSIIGIAGPITIEAGANAQAHILSADGASIVVSALSADWPVLTVLGAVSFTNFAVAENCSTTGVLYASITGASYVTGARYASILNGVIQTNGAGANYYPGSTAGATSTGGQYN